MSSVIKITVLELMCIYCSFTYSVTACVNTWVRALVCQHEEVFFPKCSAHFRGIKESLKNSKWYSEGVNQRRTVTDNTITRMKTTKGQTVIYTTLHFTLY